MRVREIRNSLPPEVVETEDMKSFEIALYTRHARGDRDQMRESLICYEDNISTVEGGNEV